MALIRTGGLVGQISGRLGADVYSHNRYGSYVRQGTIPVTSTTPYALAAKALLTEATQAWQDLSAAQKRAWANYAGENPTLNRLGQSVNLTGHAFFVGLFCRLRSVAIGAKDDPPTEAPPAPLSSLSLTGDIGPGDVAMVYTTSPVAAGENLYIWGCVVTSLGINYIQNFIRLLGRSGAEEASPFDIESMVEDRFGALAVNNILHIQASILDAGTGLLSAPRRASVTIIDTT